MGKLEQIIDRLNNYLVQRGFQKIAGMPHELDTLYEAVLRSIWKDPDKQKRENMATEVAQALKKYFGGKNLEETYYEVIEKLNLEEEKNREEAEKKMKADKLKDPNYVPSFDELFDK